MIKKLRKNKFVVLAICVIVVSLVYTVIQQAIDNYSFKNNGDIVESDDGESGDVEVDGIGNAKDGGSSDDAEKVAGEETELVLEEEADVGADGLAENGTEENAADVETNVATGAGNENKIYVYITGEVNVPGVVVLNEGSRIVDAINAAGGTTAKANVTKVNLVYVLADGMKVNIPSDNDLKNNPDFEYITMNSGDGGNDDYLRVGGSLEDGSSNTGLSNAGSSNMRNRK